MGWVSWGSSSLLGHQGSHYIRAFGGGVLGIVLESRHLGCGWLGWKYGDGWGIFALVLGDWWGSLFDGMDG